jgi:hypothetical protein
MNNKLQIFRSNFPAVRVFGVFGVCRMCMTAALLRGVNKLVPEQYIALSEQHPR